MRSTSLCRWMWPPTWAEFPTEVVLAAACELMAKIPCGPPLALGIVGRRHDELEYSMGQDRAHAGRHKPLQNIERRSEKDPVAVNRRGVTEKLHDDPLQAAALRTARATSLAISGILKPL